MTPPTLAAVLTLLSLALAIGAVLTHPLIRSRLDRRDLLILVLIGAFAGLLRVVGAEGQVYFGNEYEDSYEYVTSADWLRWNEARWPFFYNPRCLVGPNAACQTAGLSSHPVGFAALIALLSGQSGDSIAIAIGLAGVAHVLTLVPLYLAALVTTRSRVASSAGGIAFAVMPIGALYALTPMAVSASVLFASVAVLLWLLLVWDQSPAGLLAPGALTLVVVATVLLRRDHLVLLAAAPLAALLSACRPSQVLRRGVAFLVAGLLVWMLLDPKSSGMETTGSYVSRFGARYFVDLFPRFFGSLARLDWYIGFPALAGLALVRGVREPAVRFWGVIALGYTALFSAFDHGYYYPRTGEVSEAHLGRYMVQCLPALAVLAGVGAERVRRFLQRQLPFGAIAKDGFLAVLAVTWIGAAILQYQGLRGERIVFEQAYRIEPTERIARMLPTGSVVVTIEPLLLHLASEGKIFAIDLAALDLNLTLSRLVVATGVEEIFYVRRGECDGIDRERYIAGCVQVEEFQQGQAKVERIEIDGFGDLLRIPIENQGR